jgi:hypothetical protein
MLFATQANQSPNFRDVNPSRPAGWDRLLAGVENQQSIHASDGQNQLNSQNLRNARQMNKTCGYVSFDNGLSPGSEVNS